MSAPERLGRFDLRRQLGAGGMGIVYEAWDNERRQFVALKRLLDGDASAIYRLKREFRSLAGVAHPNLISLYELIGENGEWFFTMELIDGEDFITHVRAGSPWATSEDALTTPLSTSPSDEFRLEPGQHVVTAPLRELSLRPTCRARIDVLRADLRQLTEGVAAVHAAGKLHRDLKPSNVLVASTGRVVVLDFGLAAELVPSRHLTVAGTPVYMSPEQMSDQPATQASDWYALGTMLYEALTGMLPFTGTMYTLLAQKQHLDPQPPAELVSGVPDDLNALCMDLLRRVPAARPGAEEILRRLNSGPSPIRITTAAAQGQVPFVGRVAELRALHDAAATARNGQAVAVLMRGRSGLGKTALTRHFLAELRKNDPGAVILSGRCYEHESVPYKALDSLVDELMHYLRGLTPLESKSLLPTDVAALARLFPVLDDVPAVQKARAKTAAILDSREVRRRAFAALREMMARIADEHSVVLFLDDLQWGDRDSAQLVGELLRAPEAPPILLIGTYRGEEAESSAFLTEFRQLHNDHAFADDREVELEQLPADEARDLARAIVGDDAPAGQIEAIARESAGSPFFIHELGQFTEHFTEERAAETATASLDDVIRARVRRLPAMGQLLLEIVAVAGQPLATSVAIAAAAIDGEDARASIAALRAANLIRTRARAGQDDLVPYHDRVREAVLDRLSSADRQERHRQLALALERFGGDAEELSTHFQGAGELARAVEYAFAAADKAANALAFDHAARLYRFAIGEVGVDRVPPQRLVQLAETLGNAGRGAEAARYYLLAVGSVDAASALDLRRRASEHLLRSGHIDEGMRIINDVLASVGLSMPATPRRALLGIIARRILLKLRGLKYRERSGAELSPQLLAKVDVLWAATVGLIRIDNIRAAYFQAIHLQSALRLGDPFRAARAFAVESGLASVKGGHGTKQIEMLLAKADRHARMLKNPHSDGLAALSHISCSFYLGEFRATARRADEVERLFLEQCTSVTWEIDTARNVGISALYYLGEIEQLGRRIPPQLREAQERGDRYAATELTVGRPTMLWLAWDDPDTIRELISSTMGQWSYKSFHIQHFKERFSLAQIDLYNGRARDAWERIATMIDDLKKSMNLRIQFVRIEALSLRARCGLSLAIETRDPAILASVEHDANRVAAERMAWAFPLAEALRAGVFAVRGDTARARATYENAMRNFEKAEMSLYAAAARRRLGELTGGDTGNALIAAADEWMRAQTVKVPEKLARVLVP